MTAAIKDSIDILKKAQQLDREIYQLGQKIAAAYPEQKADLKRELENERQRLKALEDHLKKKQLLQKDKEGLLAQKEANIKKMDGQLGQVKTNKEYSALQQEIGALKADNSLLEEEILKLFDEVEAADIEVKKERERLKTVEKDYTAKESEIIRLESEAKSNLEKFKQERQTILSQTDPEIRGRYDLIVQKKQGIALAKISGEICAACQLQLRPQLINDVRLGQSLILCENCSRILYFED
jgi:predicted  nucleic acid-binding Zn-ribbon protein